MVNQFIDTVTPGRSCEDPGAFQMVKTRFESISVGFMWFQENVKGIQGHFWQFKGFQGQSGPFPDNVRACCDRHALHSNGFKGSQRM